MVLTAGTRLGPYEIFAQIGAGGMGEVYRARDTRLGREVAIKISAEKFSDRFEQEARAIAALSHPHICHLYDVGPDFLVMELVDGIPLKGPLPIEKAVEYAGQLLDALDAAHRKGITHRDLKPANIVVTKQGIKLLDFGLAKQSIRLGDDDATQALTAQGQILGTLQYMAPEQFQGKEADARSDLFSFGCVLYELLSGKRAFDGPVASSVIAAILEREPESIEIAQPLDRVIRRSLEKDPDQRFQTARDLKAALNWALDVGQAQALPLPMGPRSKLPWALAGVSTLALIVAGVLLYNATRPPPLKPLIRLNAEIAPDAPLTRAGGANMFALSPDGTRLALTLRGADSKVRLHTRLLTEGQNKLLAGTENASGPFFSPDGEWIGFFADGKLKKISVKGGAAATLCDAPNGRGASWGDDGNIVAALNVAGGLSRVPAAGGTPVTVTKLNPDERNHRWPQLLPGSQAVLFTAVTGNLEGAENPNIDLISLNTGERKTVGRGGFFSRYLATSIGAGHLIYLHQNTLFAVPFELGRLAPAGPPTPILEDVSSTPIAGGDFAFAETPAGPGTFVYLSGKGLTGGWSISWADSSGKVQLLHPPLGIYYTPRFSPDGKRLAFSIGDDIWVKDLDRDTPSRLTFLPGRNRWPLWTPDGRNIVFVSSSPAAPGLYWIRSDGSGVAQRLTDGKLNEIPYSFSPDGKRLAFSQTGVDWQFDILTAPIEADPASGADGVRLGNAELFLGTPFNEVFPTFSHDGRWLAYAADESGTMEVYVRPFPGPGGRWQVSTGGGRFPIWAKDGQELLFETLDGRVMAASYTVKGDSFAVSKPRVRSESQLRDLGLFSNYDLAPGGKRLAVLLADDANGEKPPTHLTFLLNFFDELRRRAPAAK